MDGTNPTTGQTGTLLLTPEGAADVPLTVAAGRLALAAYPNPFRVVTTFQYSLATPGTVDLAVYDLAGRRVATLLEAAVRGAGFGEVTWDGRDAEGVDVPGGVYFARMAAGGATVRRQIVLLR